MHFLHTPPHGSGRSRYRHTPAAATSAYDGTDGVPDDTDDGGDDEVVEGGGGVFVAIAEGGNVGVDDRARRAVGGGVRGATGTGGGDAGGMVSAEVSGLSQASAGGLHTKLAGGFLTSTGYMGDSADSSVGDEKRSGDPGVCVTTGEFRQEVAHSLSGNSGDVAIFLLF